MRIALDTKRDGVRSCFAIWMSPAAGGNRVEFPLPAVAYRFVVPEHRRSNTHGKGLGGRSWTSWLEASYETGCFARRIRFALMARHKRTGSMPERFYRIHLDDGVEIVVHWSRQVV